MNFKSLVIASVFAATASLVSMPASALVFNADHNNVFVAPFGSLFDTRTEDQAALDATGSTAFNMALNEGYIELSDDRSDAWTEPNWDFNDGELFKWKARSAARNVNVLAENSKDRDLSDAQRAEFDAAAERMHRAFERGGRFEAPKDAATAQVKYDCWMEAAEEGRADDAAACKQAFEDAMNEVEHFANYQLTEVVYFEREQAAAAPAPRSFLVYFDFDKSDIRPEGDRIIAEVIEVASADESLTIKVVGHADTSGAVDYNQALSERRTNGVIGALIDGGVNRARIVGEGVGETAPLVSTGDGVREQGNRVAEIDLF